MNSIKATWNDSVVAESTDVVVFEGTQYFPEKAVSRDHAIKTERIFHCPKRGYGVYVDLRVGENEKKDAGVYFAHPYPEAKVITGRMCFLYGIEIIP